MKFFLVWGCLALVPASLHAQTYWLSLASFKSKTYAEQFIGEHRVELAQPLVMREAATAKGRFHRVMMGPFLTEQTAREQLDSLKRRGLDGVWLLTQPDREDVVAAAAQTAPVIPQMRRETRGQTATTAVSQDARIEPDASDRPIEASTGNRTAADLGEVTAQFVPGQPIRLTKLKSPEQKIIVDGVVDEAAWRDVPAIGGYRTVRPDTLEAGEHPTHFRMMYDDRGLYFSSVMEQPPETIIRRLSGRDMFFQVNQEQFGVMLDTSGESKYGYFFGVTSSGTIMDGTILPERRMSADWDGPVLARSSLTSDGWSAEMFMPWGVLSMPNSGEVRKLKVATMRRVAYKEEDWGWPPLPDTAPRFMSLMQPIEVENIAPRQQWSVFPFLSTSYDWVDEVAETRPGADVFWRPSSNFQLNATLNPDFGNVESDAVVLNLTATETFFPEKRLFFLEGQEVFNATPRADTRGRDVGNGGLPFTMVNTRRIGGKPRRPQSAADVVIPQRELVQRTELAGAVKTTGQIGSFRYGVMGAFEDDVKFDVVSDAGPENLHQAGNDYGVARLLYETSHRGDYRAIGLLSTAVLNEDRDALVQGVDWHYRTSTGGLKIDGQYMSSDIDGVDERGYGGFLDFEMTYRQGLVHRVGLEYFDENIDINDLGFLQRNDNYRVRSALTWTKSNLSWARDNQFDLRGFAQKSVTENLFTGGAVFFSNRMRLNDLSQVTARAGYTAGYYDDLNSFGNGAFRIDDKIDLMLQWDSDSTEAWQYGVMANYKTEDIDGGDGFTIGPRVKWQPNYQFSIDLGLTYGEREGWLLHQGGTQMGTFKARQWIPNLSVEYYFNAQQQIKLGVSWVGIKANAQDFYRIRPEPGNLISIAKPDNAADYDFSVSKYSMQVRYRWEIAPLSDIYLVYTRQADLRDLLDESGFESIFDNAWSDPLEDIFVFKIRYRFGA